MKRTFSTLNKLLIAMLFLLCLPPKAAAADYPVCFSVFTNNKATQYIINEDGIGHYTGSFQITDSDDASKIIITAGDNQYYPQCGPQKGETVTLGKSTPIFYRNGEETSFSENLTSGQYDVEINVLTAIQDQSRIELLITKNDGSINELSYSTDLTNWVTAKKIDEFKLPRTKFAAGGKLYISHKFKAPDPETKVTYYHYSGAPVDLADGEEVNVSLTCTQSENATPGEADCLTFKNEGTYTITSFSIDQIDKTKALCHIKRVDFLPTFDPTTLKYTYTGSDGKVKTGTLETGTSFDVENTRNLKFTIKEQNGDTEYTVYPEEARALRHCKDVNEKRVITFSVDKRLYEGNYFKSYHNGTLTPKEIVCNADGEVTLTYNYRVTNADRLPRLMLFDKNATPGNLIQNGTDLTGYYFNSNDIQKEVMLRDDTNGTFTGVIQLTQDDIDNTVMTVAPFEGWSSFAGYTFPTSKQNILLRGEPSKISLGMTLGSASSENGMLRFGSRFTPGTYLITLQMADYSSADPLNSLKKPCTITIQPTVTTYYHIEAKDGSKTDWRESVGVGVLRKFNYDKIDPDNTIGLRAAYNATKLFLRTDSISESARGKMKTTYYKGTVEFTSDAIGATRTFLLEKADEESADTYIDVKSSGQFIMSFDHNTRILTVTRVAKSPIPVRGAVAIDPTDDGIITDQTEISQQIIPVGGQKTIHVTEAGKRLVFWANYDQNPSEGATRTNEEERSIPEYAARIYPDQDIILSDDYEFYTFSNTNPESHTITADKEGYYTFTARVYPKLNQILIACQYTNYNPETTLKSDFSNTVFGEYPYIAGDQSFIQNEVGNASSYSVIMPTTYIIRGIPLDNHNEFLKKEGKTPLEPLVPEESEKYNKIFKLEEGTGERLKDANGDFIYDGTYAAGELVRGNRYTFESVDDLFGPNGVLLGSDKSFDNLVKLRAENQARAHARLTAVGGRVSFVVQFTSSSLSDRLCYFYVTPEMQKRILTQYENSAFYNELSKFPAFEGIGDENDPNDDGVFTKCLMAAINDGVIPGFAVLTKAASCGAVKYTSVDGNRNKTYVSVQNNGDLSTPFDDNANRRHYYGAGAWIEGCRIPLAFFGDDYRGEASSDFPAGTLIYPYIIDHDDAEYYSLPYKSGKSDDNTTNYKTSKFRFSDARLNLLGMNLTWNLSKEDDKTKATKLHELTKNWGRPAAFTFNYNTRNLRGEPIKMALVAWEDDTNDNFRDLVLNVDGVEQVFDKVYTAFDFEVDARPASNIEGTQHNYTHTVSLKPKKSALGSDLWKANAFGNPIAKINDEGNAWIAQPTYSYIDVFRDDAFIGQIVFKKTICKDMLDEEYNKSFNATQKPAEDDELHTTINYAWIPNERQLKFNAGKIVFEDGKSDATVEAASIAAINRGWTEIFHDARGSGDKDVPIRFVRFPDSFNEKFGEAKHTYAGEFYSDAKSIESDPDEVIVPESTLAIAPQTGVEFPADTYNQAITSLPETQGETAESANSIAVARNLSLAGKETISSYDIFEVNTPATEEGGTVMRESAQETETLVATVAPTSTTTDETAMTVTANGWKLTTPGSDEVTELTDNRNSVSGDTYSVKFGTNNVIKPGKTYRVKINTTVPEVTERDVTFKCTYSANAEDEEGNYKVELLTPDNTANTYGGEPAMSKGADAALTLKVEAPDMGTLRSFDGEKNVTYVNTPSWTIDLSMFPGVDPADVKYCLWRQYSEGTPAYEPAPEEADAAPYYLPTLFDNVSTPGMITSEMFTDWQNAWAPDIDMVRTGNTVTMNDVMVTKWVGEGKENTDQVLGANYVLYAYIPLYDVEAETPVTPAPGKVIARAYGEQTAATRYYVVKANTPMEVKGYEEEVTTGIGAVAESGINIHGAGGVLTVTGATDVKVYTVSGIEVYSAEGDVTKAMTPGIYIVKADNKVAKISL